MDFGGGVTTLERPRGRLSLDEQKDAPEIELLTTREAAALTKMSIKWFERMRYERTGPPFLRRGRTIRYVKADLVAWWQQGKVVARYDR